MFLINLLQTQIELLVLLTDLQPIRVDQLTAGLLRATLQVRELLEVAVKQNRVLATELNQRILLEVFQHPLQVLLDHHRVQEVLRVILDLQAALQVAGHLAAVAVDQAAALEENNYYRSTIKRL